MRSKVTRAAIDAGTQRSRDTETPGHDDRERLSRRDVMVKSESLAGKEGRFTPAQAVTNSTGDPKRIFLHSMDSKS